MERYHQDHNLVGFSEGSGFHKTLLESAGFVDIKIYRKSFDNRDWRVGTAFTFLKPEISEQCPSRAAASRACTSAFSHPACIAETLFKDLGLQFCAADYLRLIQMTEHHNGEMKLGHEEDENLQVLRHR